MSDKPVKIVPYVPHYARGGNEVLMEQERTFYDRSGNHALVTSVVYRDKKGVIHQEDIRVKWLNIKPAVKVEKPKVTVERVYISLMVCSNGLFFYTTLQMSDGRRETPSHSKELYRALYEIATWANTFDIEPDVYLSNEYVSETDVQAAYKEIKRMVERLKMSRNQKSYF